MDGDDDDFELLRAWRAGDRRSGSELVQRHFSALYRFFRNKVDEGPKDLIQQTLTTCVEIRDRVPDGVTFRAYLLGVARNELLHHLRGRTRQATAFRRQADAGVSAVRSPSQIAVARQEQRLLLDALRMLPLDAQIAIELFYWENLKIEEIAAVVDAAPGTIKSRLSRGKQQLRAAIERLAATPDLRRSTLDGLDGWARSLRDPTAAASDEG